ncbi:MAG: hypothetical protein J6A75_13325 [Lachnospiraceae bacterium]|nr:hypothetical protein [Lachnospiraceae bacterium]
MFRKKALQEELNYKEEIIKEQGELLSHIQQQAMLNDGYYILTGQITNYELLHCFDKYVHWDDTYTNEELLNMLISAKEFLDRVEVSCVSFYNIREDIIKQNRPLSFRQASRSLAVTELIIEGNYNEAMHELQDCIVNYRNDERLKISVISVNEYTIYMCLIEFFIHQISASCKEL